MKKISFPGLISEIPEKIIIGPVMARHLRACRELPAGIAKVTRPWVRVHPDSRLLLSLSRTQRRAIHSSGVNIGLF